MKIPPRDAERFVRVPDPGLRAILVYGPDQGLARERTAALLGSVVEDPNDPFRVVELTGAALKDDPARLGDEAAALALTGGRRVVCLRGAGDGLAGLFKEFLAAEGGDALVLVEAGDLSTRSPLRKVFETAKRGAALACYRDDARSLAAVITSMLAAEGLRASADALAYLCANLGGDRQVTRRELEKLALYMGAGEGGPGSAAPDGAAPDGAAPGSGDPVGDGPEGGVIGLEAARAVVGDSASLSLDDLAFAVADGDLPAVERSLGRSLHEGVAPIAALRAAARHLQRLHLVAGRRARGVTLEQAIMELRPPVFWKYAGRFTQQARGWPAPALGRALARLLEAEMAAKQSGAPAETLCARVLLEVAAKGPLGPRPGRG